MAHVTKILVITTKVERTDEWASFDEFVTSLGNIVDHTPYDVQVRETVSIPDFMVHTPRYQYDAVVEVLQEELRHWQEILDEQPDSDQAGLRAAGLFHFLCDLKVKGFEC